MVDPAQASRLDRGIVGELKPGKWFGRFDKTTCAKATMMAVQPSTLLLVTYECYQGALLHTDTGPSSPAYLPSSYTSDTDVDLLTFDTNKLGDGSFAQVFISSVGFSFVWR